MKKTLLASLALASLLLPAALRAAGPGSGSSSRSSSSFGSAGGDELRVEVKDGDGVVLHKGKEVWSGKVDGALSTRSTTAKGETRLQAFDGDTLVWEARESAPAGVTGSSSSRSFSSRSSGAAEVPADVQAVIDGALKDSHAVMDEAMQQHRKAVEDARRHIERAGGGTVVGNGRSVAPAEEEETNGPRKMNRSGTIGKPDRERRDPAKVLAPKESSAAETREESPSVDAKSGIRVEVNNGKAEVVYNGETVWSGKVKSGAPVRALASSVNGEEHAAAFAGDEVLWENRDGAADALR